MEKKPKTSDQLYLEKLEFDPSLRKTWLNFFVSNFRVVILLIILITGWGIYSFLALPRESNPEVKIPYGIVATAYPGASPTDVEELVSKKIETKISSLKGVKRITSNSSNSFSAITVEFEANQDIDDSIRKLTDKVNEAKPNLPKEATSPVVSEISFDDTPIWSIALSGPVDGFTLRDYAETIKDELEKIPGIREVRISGGDEREFSVAYDPDKLIFYNISADQANQAISTANLAIPSGIFEGDKYSYPVRADGRFFDSESLKKLLVSQGEGGSVVYLGDIAKVEEKAIKRSVISRLSIKGEAPQNAVTIDVIKKTGGSIVDTVDAASSKVDELVKTFQPGVQYDVMQDLAKLIRKDFDQLTHDFLFTLLLVGGLLFLIVGLKEAFVAGLAIPLVFFVTFGVMSLTGISLNFLSIFSLLLSLGLLVDDAIVVVSATKQYLKTGKFTPEEAVLLVLNDFKVVLTTTTLTTVWAFLPLLMASGIIGSFIRSIPITVSVTLVASLFVALMVNHPLAAVLERIRLTRGLFIASGLLLFAVAFGSFIVGGVAGWVLGIASLAGIFFMLRWWARGGRPRLLENERLVAAERNNDELIKEKLRTQADHENDERGWASRLIHGIVHFDRIIPVYEKYLRLVLSSKKTRRKLLGTVGAVFLGAMLLLAFGIIPTEFFPVSDQNTVYVNIKAPTGLKLAETDAITRQVEEKLLSHGEIANFSTVVGASNGMEGRSLQDSGDRASITVTLKDKEERNIASYDFATELRKELSGISGAEITVDSIRGGPPSGSAFEARISGDDLGKIEAVATEMKDVLSGIPGVINADISLKDAPAEYTFALIPEALSRYNMNAAYVGSALRMAISGSKVTTVIKGNKEIDVVARFDDEKIPTLASVQNLQIINLRQQPVFLKDIAAIELRPAVQAITRIDQKRTVILSAGVEGATRPAAVLSQFQEKIKNGHPLPDGYAISYGGENEQNAESVNSILRAMVVAALLIVSTLIIQFNSFKQAFIVLITFPLALIGAFYGMALFGISLSFPGLIGILALFGIVVKNAIILIDKMNLNLRSGIPYLEAVIDAGKSRLEAIFITSVCTIMGIIPITFSNELWTALGSAIIFGLTLSSLLTLFVVPTLFVSFVKEER